MLPTYLLHCDGLLRGLVQLLNSLRVKSQILLATDEDDWESRAEMQHFGNPLPNWSVNTAEYVDVMSRTFSCTLSRESGESMAKQMRMTCESG
jgi:hypothetical protein